MTLTPAFYVRCDWPGCKRTKLVIGMTRDRTVSELRHHNWALSRAGDWCPVHAKEARV